MEFILEILGGFVLLALGYVIGSLVFLVVRTMRWSLLRAERSRVATDRHGGQWTVRVPLAPARLKFGLSKRAFRMGRTERAMRRRGGVADDGVARSEMAHPSKLIDAAEFAPVVAFVLLVIFVVAAVVFVVELIIVAIVAAAVAGIRMLWGRWQCEVVAPNGDRTVLRASSLKEAKANCSWIAESIAAGKGIPSALT